MCDEKTLNDANEYLGGSGGLTRRQFGSLSVGMGLSMLLPRAANAQAVTEVDVDVPTPRWNRRLLFRASVERREFRRNHLARHTWPAPRPSG